jgi:hypothetical protein
MKEQEKSTSSEPEYNRDSSISDLLKAFNEIEKEEQEENYTLLSVKYEIDNVSLNKLLDYYNNRHGEAKRRAVFWRAQSPPDSMKESPDQSICQLSKRHSLPKSTIASLLIDYKILKSTTKAKE